MGKGYGLTVKEYKNDQYSERAYIDHNGFLTDEVIKKGEDPHGYDWISKKLINLLKRHKETSHKIAVQNIAYYESSVEGLSGFYSGETDEDNIEVIQINDDEGEFGLLEYKVLLPLWYIVYTFICSHNIQEDNKVLYYKNLSSQELATILKEDHHKRDNNLINHDVFMLDLSSGGVYNIGG